jgi:Raf kinase inhibitor-like YbhB/YbcL family protein
MASEKLTVSSPEFQQDGQIPSKYTCDGEDVNPPLHVENIPQNAESLALIVEDPDAPDGLFVHWLVWNMDPAKTIAPDSIPGIVGTNSFGNNTYGGPCPPSGSHRYNFRVFALDSKLNLPPSADKKALEQALQPHVLAEGTLVGRYARAGK